MNLWRATALWCALLWGCPAPTPPPNPNPNPFCNLPGSFVHDAAGTHVVAGGSAQPDLAWLTLPVGFCAHHYARVPNARQLRFAPGGELFVASPTTVTTSNGSGGLSAIAVVPDDDKDGVGDSVLTFLGGLPSTQGLLFANGSFYYQDGNRILKEPYVKGQRADNGQSQTVVDVEIYHSGLHWPKTLDVSDTGHLYVANGGDQGERCEQPMPFHGGILAIDGTDGGTPIAMGLRNPIDVKCHRDGHDLCYATELAMDYSASAGGREKLLPIHPGDNWGYPCCATQNLPYTGVTVPCAADAGTLCTPNCGAVAPEAGAFVIGNTPFGFDFVDSQFPSPWDHQVIVALHGAAGTWAGAKLVAIGLDPVSGLPIPASNLAGGNGMQDFATGWDDGARDHGRPADVELSPDGRLFIANDQNGEIFWIAPLAAP